MTPEEMKKDRENLVHCADCNKDVNDDEAVFDSQHGEWVCESHLDNKTGYCSISCQRGGGCDGSC